MKARETKASVKRRIKKWRERAEGMRPFSPVEEYQIQRSFASPGQCHVRRYWSMARGVGTGEHLASYVDPREAATKILAAVLGDDAATTSALRRVFAAEIRRFLAVPERFHGAPTLSFRQSTLIMSAVNYWRASLRSKSPKRSAA